MQEWLEEGDCLDVGDDKFFFFWCWRWFDHRRVAQEHSTFHWYKRWYVGDWGSFWLCHLVFDFAIDVILGACSTGSLWCFAAVCSSWCFVAVFWCYMTGALLFQLLLLSIVSKILFTAVPRKSKHRKVKLTMPSPLHKAVAPNRTIRHNAVHKCVLVWGILRGNKNLNKVAHFVVHVAGMLAWGICVQGAWIRCGVGYWWKLNNSSNKWE